MVEGKGEGRWWKGREREGGGREGTEKVVEGKGERRWVIFVARNPILGRGEQDVPRYTELRSILTSSAPGDGGWGHCVLPPSPHSRVRDEQDPGIQEGVSNGHLKTVPL